VDKQDETVIHRTNGRAKDFTEHTEMDDVVVTSENNFSSDGSFKEQKEKEQKARSSKEPDTSLDHTESSQADQTHNTRRQAKAKILTRTKQQKENAKKEKKRQKKLKACIWGNSIAAHINFDRSLPSGTAARADHLNMLERVTIPQTDSSTMMAMLKPIRRRRRGMSAAAAAAAALAEACMPVASRSEPSIEKVTRESMATLSPGQWLNDEVINFVGQVLIAPRRSNTNSRAHVYSSYFMSRLMSGGQDGD